MPSNSPRRTWLFRPRLDAKSVLLAALILIVVAAVMFGIDLINGRWDQPPIQHPI
jgi:hypothetical protein